MRIIPGQGSQLATGFNHIKNGVDHLADVDRARTAHFTLSNKIFEQFPLAITQVTWISFYLHTLSIVQAEGVERNFEDRLLEFFKYWLFNNNL